MKPDGWIKLHRRLTENVVLMHDNNAYMVFTKLLLFVNSKGQWAGGRNQLGEKVNLNSRTLYDVLKRLEEQQIINIKSNKLYSTISICNWSRYQANPNRQPNNDPTISQQSANTLIRIKNKNKESDKPAKLGAGYRKAKQTAQLIKKKNPISS